MKHPDGYFRYQLKNKIVASKHPMPRHAGKEILPTDAEFADFWVAEPMRLLRIERNQLLAQSDWMAVADRVMTQAQIDYRQALRDLPQHSSPALDEQGNLMNVEWPTPPSEA